ncbi:protein of unknown function [Hyphomicrobium sp. MC1]|nr:protein of unknown function [Hyphomicrobium sp. MC1]
MERRWYAQGHFSPCLLMGRQQMLLRQHLHLAAVAHHVCTAGIALAIGWLKLTTYRSPRTTPRSQPVLCWH